MAEWNKADYDFHYQYEAGGKCPHQQPLYTHYNNHMAGANQRLYKAPMLLPYILGNTVVVGGAYAWLVEGLVAAGVNAVGTEISNYILTTKDTDEEADLRGYIIDSGRDPDNDWIICSPDHPQAVYMEDPNKRHAQTGEWVPGLFEWMCHPIQLIYNRVGPRTDATIVDEDSATNGSRQRIKNQLGSVDMVITQQVLNSIPDADVLDLCQHMAGFNKPVVHILSPLQPDAVQDPVFNWKTYQQWSSFIAQFPNQKILGSVGVEGYAAYSRLI